LPADADSYARYAARRRYADVDEGRFILRRRRCRFMPPDLRLRVVSHMLAFISPPLDADIATPLSPALSR